MPASMLAAANRLRDIAPFNYTSMNDTREFFVAGLGLLDLESLERTEDGRDDVIEDDDYSGHSSKLEPDDDALDEHELLEFLNGALFHTI